MKKATRTKTKKEVMSLFRNKMVSTKKKQAHCYYSLCVLDAAARTFALGSPDISL